IIVALLLIFSAILVSDVEEADEQPKDEEVVAEEKTEKKDEPAEELTDVDRIKSVVAKEISEDRIEDVTYFDGYTTLKIRAQDNLTSNMIQRSMWIDAGDIFAALKDANYDV